MGRSFFYNLDIIYTLARNVDQECYKKSEIK